MSLVISDYKHEAMVEAFSEYVPGPGSLLKYSMSSSLPSNLKSFEPKGGTILLLDLSMKLL